MCNCPCFPFGIIYFLLYSNNFSPYPHQQARIIEFPRYAGFAQAFPGTMPYSENMGFIADLKDKLPNQDRLRQPYEEYYFDSQV